MKKLLIFIATFFLINAKPVIKENSDFIIAKINNKAITSLELEDRYRFVIAIAKISIKSPQDKKVLTHQILDKMVDEELIRQDAKNLKIEASAAEIREAVDEVALSQKKNSTQCKFFFINNNLSFDSYLKQIESEVLWQKIVSEVLRSKAKITEVETKEFFEQQKFNTDVKKFLIAEIFIPQSEDSAQLANKLVLELKYGADFVNIVRQFSRGINSENNGEIGWVSQSDIDAKIYNSIHKIAKGDYSDPVLLSDGYHIFKVLDIKVETKIADHDLTAARNIIFARKIQTIAQGYLMDLRKKSFIEVIKN